MKIRMALVSALLVLATAALGGAPSYDAFSDRDGNIATEQHAEAAKALLKDAEQLEAVYADAAAGNPRAARVCQELENQAILAAANALLGAGVAVAALREVEIASRVSRAPSVVQSLEAPAATGSQVASHAATVAKRVPELTRGTSREMLGQALRHVKELSGAAADKANLFEALAGQISRQSAGTWSAMRASGVDGSHVFLGTAGEALVIDQGGNIFRGSLMPGGGVRPAAPGQFSIDYTKLRGVP